MRKLWTYTTVTLCISLRIQQRLSILFSLLLSYLLFLFPWDQLEASRTILSRRVGLGTNPNLWSTLTRCVGPQGGPRGANKLSSDLMLSYQPSAERRQRVQTCSRPGGIRVSNHLFPVYRQPLAGMYRQWSAPWRPLDISYISSRKYL